MSRPKIITIAAVSGGGKTTITSRLSQILRESKALYFDEYDLEGPEDIIEWVDRGADCNEWNIDPIVSDISKLINSGEIEYILIDYPFARLHSKLRNIDLTVFLNTPLDIALARRIIRDCGNRNETDILNDLMNYLTRERRGFESMLETTKPNSDLVIEGVHTIEEIVRIVCEEIKKIL